MTDAAVEAMSPRQRVGLALGPALFILLLFTPFGPQPETHRLAAVAVLMATWWITEAIPIPATALLPLVLFPMMGIMGSGPTASTYVNDSIMLFVGGFILALGVERWGLHRRIALGILCTVGDSPRLLVLGFMCAAAILSMWISNTATAMMMLPIGMSVTTLARARTGSTASTDAMCACLMLGIAYGCSIGGTATLVGTPPNIAFQRIFLEEFPGGPEITFFRWFQIGLPVAVAFLIIAWLVLTRLVFRLGSMSAFGGHEEIVRERSQLGPMSRAEFRVAVVMAATAVLWIWRSEVDFGFFKIPGWSMLIETLPFMHITDPETGKTLLHDATVAMAAGLALFLIPAGDGSGRRLMNWQTAERIPYGILFLFGGGFALAAGFKTSGLSAWLADAFTQSPLVTGSPIVLVGALATGMTFITELTSNTATTQMVLPILASLARSGADLNPLIIMVPATLSASFAFMLPVATPPNAIVFGSGQIRMMDMVRAGLVLNLIGVIIVVGLVYGLTLFVFGINPHPMPVEWLGVGASAH